MSIQCAACSTVIERSNSAYTAVSDKFCRVSELYKLSENRARDTFGFFPPFPIVEHLDHRGTGHPVRLPLSQCDDVF